MKKLNDKVLEKVWGEFADIPIDKNDNTSKRFRQFPKGTSKLEVWHWFDDNHSLGIVKGLFSLRGKHEYY